MDGCQFFTTELFTIMDTQYFDLKQNVWEINHRQILKSDVENFLYI